MKFFFVVMFFFVNAGYAQTYAYTAEIKNTYQLGLTAYESNNIELAQNNFATVLKLDSTCYEAHYMLAVLFYDKQAFGAALHELDEVKKRRPFDPQSLALEGKIHYFLSDYARAEQFLKRAISLGQTDNQNLYFLALTLNQNRAYNASLYYFNELLKLDSTAGQYWTGRGNVFMGMEKYADAVDDFKQSLTLDSSQIETRVTLIQLLNTIDRSAESVEYITEGLKISQGEDRLQLLLLQGNYYRQQGKYDQSDEAFSAAYTIDRNNPLVLTYQSSLLIDMEEFDKAVVKCNEALEIDPTLTEAYFNRGIAYEMLRDIDQACSDWQQAFILGSQKAIEYLNGPVCNE